MGKDSIKDVMGAKIWQYCNSVMVDDLSIGLRDKVAHGLILKSECGQDVATMLVHLLLLISGLRH